MVVRICASNIRYGSLVVSLFLFLALPLVSSADALTQQGTPTEPDNIARAENELEKIELDDSELSAVGEFVTLSGGELSIEPAMLPPSNLAQQDYQKVYNNATALLNKGVTFRTTRLQLLPIGDEYGPVITDPLQNYQSFNDGELFHAFCSDYDQIDDRGFCPSDDPSQWPESDEAIRGQLVRAREMFGFLALADPANIEIVVEGQPVNIRDVGREGLLAATRELANIHLIFGNEFLVDALDYRFGVGDPRADIIITEELDQLALARQQFKLGADVLAHAFNADFGGPNGANIADFFGAREFELFGIVSERLVETVNEMADRHRQLGQDDEALDLYADAYTDQYIHSLALAYSAMEQGEDFLENGGWEFVNNLERLQAATQSIYTGANSFGFVNEYVPLQTFDTLIDLTRNLLRDATQDEGRAEATQREFDSNRTALQQELQGLRLTYDTQLLQICGASTDNYVTCAAGLMEQNEHTMEAAAKRMRLIDQQLENIVQQVEIEQERAGQVIEITLANGEALAADEYAKGVISAHRVTAANVRTSNDEFYGGGEVRITLNNNIGIPPKWGVNVNASVFAGYRHSESWTDSVTQIWDPTREELGAIDSVRALRQAITQADIIGVESDTRIRAILLQEAELLIQREIAVAEWNRLSAEHNHLVEQYHNWLNLRELAQANVLDSYLNNPAFRIMRDQSTLEAVRSIGLAGQFAYLTAKALEYEFLEPIPFLNDIFKARTADDIDNFLNQLEVHRQTLGSPGERNRFPRRVSLVRDLLGFTDEVLDPDVTLFPFEVEQLRFERFQEFMQQNVITDANTGLVTGVEMYFATSLADNRLFSSNVWNNRIAGEGLPQNVPGTQGIRANIVTRQFGDIGTPELLLTHGGHATYRTINGEFIEYTPENARPSGYPVPIGFQSQTKTAAILASVNGNGEGVASSALFNRSVAASNWVLRLELDSAPNLNLDVNEIEDIEFDVDTTGIAIPHLRLQAAADSLQFQAEFEEEKEK